MSKVRAFWFPPSRVTDLEDNTLQSVKVDFPSFRERAPGSAATCRPYGISSRGAAGGSWRYSGRATAPAALRWRQPRGAPDRRRGRTAAGGLIHGLTGCETATNMVVAARHMNGLGFRYCGSTCGALSHLRRHRKDITTQGARRTCGHAFGPAPEVKANGLLIMGFSLGGNMLLKFLAESGRNYPVHAAVAVSTPIDLTESAIRLMRRRNAVYHSWLLKRMKAQWSDTTLSGDYAQALQDANSILEFDDRIVGPVNGFPGARAYYEHNSAERYLADIPVPTLLIHARNDPWIGSNPTTGLTGARTPISGCCSRKVAAMSGFTDNRAKRPGTACARDGFSRNRPALGLGRLAHRL